MALGYTIGLEGIDGAGKSTVSTLIRTWCAARGLYATVCRADGKFSVAPQSVASLSPSERQTQFWQNLVLPSFADQHRGIAQLRKQSDVLIMERTFISYLMGRTRVYGQTLDRCIIQRSMKQFIQEVPWFIDWHSLWFITRSPQTILESLKERRAQVQLLSSFDQFLLDHPAFIADDQQRFAYACTLMGATIIDNNSDFDTLRTSVYTKLEAGLKAILSE